MPRPDWDITREETGKTFYADLPTLVETLKVRHTMTFRPTGLVKVFEMNYTTPTDNDLVRQENLWIERLEKSAQVPLVPMGDIDTNPPVINPLDQKLASVANALRFAEAAKASQDKLTAQGEALKLAFPADAAAIDKALIDSKSAAEAQVVAALDALKATDTAVVVTPVVP